jgi:hypothetical protein
MTGSVINPTGVSSWSTKPFTEWASRRLFGQLDTLKPHTLWDSRSPIPLGHPPVIHVRCSVNLGLNLFNVWMIQVCHHG